MTSKTNKAKSATDTYFDQVRQTVETVQSRFEVPAAARDFVQRSATTAKEGAESAHTGANQLATGAEKLATSLIGGYAGFSRSLIDATFANLQHAFGTVEKMASAKSVNEAVQLQSDFVRESAKANYDRFREAAETAHTSVMEGAEQVQAELSRLSALGKQAA